MAHMHVYTRLTCVIICFKTLEWQDNRPNGLVDVDSPACAKDLGPSNGPGLNSLNLYI